MTERARLRRPPTRLRIHGCLQEMTIAAIHCRKDGRPGGFGPGGVSPHRHVRVKGVVGVYMHSSFLSLEQAGSFGLVDGLSTCFWVLHVVYVVGCSPP